MKQAKMNIDQCRPEAPVGKIALPADFVKHYASRREDLPIFVAFDARGPAICLSAGTGNAQDVFSTVVPLDPAGIQKELYHQGERYWRRWTEIENTYRKASAEKEKKERASKKKGLIITCVIVVLLFVALGAVITVGVCLSNTKKNKMPTANPTGPAN